MATLWLHKRTIPHLNVLQIRLDGLQVLHWEQNSLWAQIGQLIYTLHSSTELVIATILDTDKGVDALGFRLRAQVGRSEISWVLAVKGVSPVNIARAPTTTLLVHYTTMVCLDRNRTHLTHWLESTNDTRLVFRVRALYEILRHLGRACLLILAKKLGFNLLPELLWLIVGVIWMMVPQVASLNITEYLLDSVLVTRLFAVGSPTR